VKSSLDPPLLPLPATYSCSLEASPKVLLDSLRRNFIDFRPSTVSFSWR
jgi:hypothetical protein